MRKILIMAVGIITIFLIFGVISTASMSTTANNATNKTDNNTAPRILNITIRDITNSSINITFSVDQSNARTIIKYGIDGGNLNKVSDWNNITSTSRKIGLDNLLNNTKYYFSIFAYNKSNLSRFSFSTTRNFVTKNDTIKSNNTNNTNATGGRPKIDSKSPVQQIINIIVGETEDFDISFNQTVNVTWYLNSSSSSNSTRVKSERLVKSSHFNDTKSINIGSWFINVTGENKNGSVSNSWTLKVHDKSYNIGNRIWDSTKDMDTTYTWNSYSFAGFYYDIDENVLTEELTIKNIDRSLNKGDIVYKTSPLEVKFEHNDFGKYQVIGFMADKYFAGYTSNSTISNKDDISALGSGNLHKVLIDDDVKRAVQVGGTLTLQDGYTLKMKEIDVGAGTGQIWVVLLKDGSEVDDDVVSAKDDYIYTKKVGSIDQFPLIAIHFDSVFRGKEVNAAFVKGIFQISETFTEVKSGTRYDKMEIESVNKDEIRMENRDTIGLNKGDTIDLMGNLKIIVADSDDLRFGLSIDRTGIFEARGTIYPIVNQWTPLNFGLDIGGKNVGFYYDIDEDIGTEKLSISGIDGRTIKTGRLIYSTSPQEVSFKYGNFGKYNVIGFMADKYFAGYTTRSIISNKDEIDTIGDGQLHKVLIDDDDKRTISEGGTLSLQEDYILKMTAVDIGAGPGQIWIVLLKNGNEVDNDVVAGGENYIYTKKVGSISDFPLIAIHFDSVFRGREVNAAFVKGIFQISETFTEVKSGKTYGKMEVSSVGNEIRMENSNTIGLDTGDTIDIMGDIKFRVADDSNHLRFYPFVLVDAENMTKLVIDSPSKANTGDTIVINITSGGNAIGDVSISVNVPEIGIISAKTDERGILNYTIPSNLKEGTYTITASKTGYQSATKTIEIQRYIANMLSIDAPAMAHQFENITIKVIANNTAIDGAKITFDNNTIGLTDTNGILNYTLQSSGSHTITASKDGYVSVSRYIEVKEPFSDFKALDISIIPNKIDIGGRILIKSNITNAGTKADTKNIELIVNSSIVENQSLTLNPKETKEINFDYKITLPEGNYTIEILGQNGSVEVQKSSGSILWIVLLITIIGAGVIYVATLKDKTAINNIIASMRQKIKR